MITLRKASTRGHADHGWLKTWHSFSFATYHAPEHMGFKSLRVINEDVIAGHQGFGTHPHRDMEILTYIISGSLEHKDSMGNGSVIQAGELQRMTAGSGVTHSEHNPSPSPTHLYQIWIFPEEKSLPPSYEQKKFAFETNTLTPIASRQGHDSSLTIHQDIDIFQGSLEQGAQTTYSVKRSGAWLQVISGTLEVNGLQAHTSDGLQIENELTLTLNALETSQYLLFDLN